MFILSTLVILFTMMSLLWFHEHYQTKNALITRHLLQHYHLLTFSIIIYTTLLNHLFSLCLGVFYTIILLCFNKLFLPSAKHALKKTAPLFIYAAIVAYTSASTVSIIALWLITSISNTVYQLWGDHYFHTRKMQQVSCDASQPYVNFLANHFPCIQLRVIQGKSKHTINAAAIPYGIKKGSIFISETSLTQCHKKDILYALLSHESTHLCEHHTLKLSLMQNIIIGLFLISTLFVETPPSSIDTAAFFCGFITVWYFMTLPVFSAMKRCYEIAADKSATHTVPKAQYLNLLQTLEDNQPDLVDFSTYFAIIFATHPPLSKRIERLKE